MIVLTYNGDAIICITDKYAEYLKDSTCFDFDTRTMNLNGIIHIYYGSTLRETLEKVESSYDISFKEMFGKNIDEFLDTIKNTKLADVEKEDHVFLKKPNPDSFFIFRECLPISKKAN